MAYYTWTGNVNKGEQISSLSLRGNTLTILPGQFADLTPQEVSDLSQRVVLTPGQSGAPANISNSPTPPPTVLRMGNVGAKSTVKATGLTEISVSLTLTADHTVTITGLSGWVRIFVNVQQDAAGGHSLTVNAGGAAAAIPINDGPNEITLAEGRYDGVDLWVRGTDSDTGLSAGSSGGAFLRALGDWNASTNTPPLADGSGEEGDWYRVSVAGTMSVGSIPFVFKVGDYVNYDGSTWNRVSAGVADLGTIHSGDRFGAIASLVLGQYTRHSEIIKIGAPCTITGLGMENAATVAGNLKFYAFDPVTGTIIAASASTAQAGASAMQQIAFSAPLAVVAGLLGIGAISDSTTATGFSASPRVKYSRVANGSFVLPASITPPASVSITAAPILYTY